MSKSRPITSDPSPESAPANAVPAGALGSPAGPAKVLQQQPAYSEPSRTSSIKPADASARSLPKGRGFWTEVWRRYRKGPLGIVALVYVVLLTIIAILSPAIAGTKPVICKYKGGYSMPCLGYFYEPWEDKLEVAQAFRKRYTPKKFEQESGSWAIWPLVFQDPFRRVRANEWPDQPGNPSGIEGKPSQYNLLGTNQVGIDVLAVLVHGTRVALLVGFISTGIAAAIGMTLGALAGYFGGWVDILISRLIEVMMCIPTLVLILALLAIVDRATIWHTMVVLGVTGWTSIARLMRAEFLKLRTTEYVTAARAIGASQARVMFRHILPNALAPVLVPITFGIASAILVENALSFLGFGSPPPSASWGTLLSAGQRNLEMWWLVVFPGLAIFLTVMAYNLIGEGLQEATDPRLREGTK
ncbi:MAG: ABC transporter permease [Planctomycetaceae bacterium]|nr:ABC transporter permease [Planctomycetaceae bacterium]